MILTALSDYYERLLEQQTPGLSLPGYSSEKVGYVLVLSPKGEVVDVLSNHAMDGKKSVAKSMSVPASFKRPGTTPKSFFLWDKTSYIFGVSREGKDGMIETPKHFEAFKALHREKLEGNEDPGLRALLMFLDAWSPAFFAQAPFHDEMIDANFVFRLDDDNREYLHDRSAARRLWSAMQTGADVPSGLCLVTGEVAPLARLHPAIKGVNGAQSSGASIVSFNLDAFASYGKSQGENAPISEQAAFAYTTALNYMLRRDADNHQRLQIGDATVVFWAVSDDKMQTDAAQSLFELMLDPPPDDGQQAQRLRHVLEQVRDLQAQPDLDPGLHRDTRMFVLGLAPNASRLSIRYWLHDSITEFAKRLADHYDDLRIEPVPWKTPHPLWRLLLATAPSFQGKASSDDVSPQLAGEFARAVLGGSYYPQSLLNSLVMRMRADGEVSPTRVALCKAVLVRKQRLDRNIDKGVPVSLDITNTDPGYLLGRLFSILENAQRAALGDRLNATIRDRYYGAASATPASVFPVLLRNAQHHLSRLRKDKPGLAVNLEKDIGEIFEQLGTEFPRSLRIEAQGHFAIGYYHQTQARFARSDAQNVNENEGEDA